MSEEEPIRSLQSQLRYVTDQLAAAQLEIATLTARVMRIEPLEVAMYKAMGERDKAYKDVATLTARVQELELHHVMTTLEGGTSPPERQDP